MKITYLNTMDISGGAARAAFRLLKGVRKQNIPANMLVQQKESDCAFIEGPKTNTAKAIAALKIPLNNIPILLYPKRQNTLFHSQWAPDFIANKIKKKNSDIIHLHWICKGFINVAALSSLNKPMLWTLHDMWPFTGGCHYAGDCTRYKDQCGRCPQLGSRFEKDLSRWNWYRKKKLWKNIDLTIVTPSRWLARCAKESALFKDKRIEIIPNGIDMDCYKPFEKSLARNIFSLPQDKKLILFGAMGATGNKLKGFDFFESTLHKLGQTDIGKDIELVVFGASRPSNPPNYNIKVSYLGRLHDDILISLLYSACDVFVAPSKVDNLPNTIMESISCGTPCVAFNVGGISDMLTHKKNGYLALPFDTNDLAKGIIWTIKDKKRWDTLSLYAREKAELKYNISYISKQYIKLYKELYNK